MNMKRILSAALVLAMLVGFVPGAGVTAKADDEPTATTTIRQDTANHQATMTVSLTVPAKEPVAYLDWDDTQKKLVEKTGDDACKTYNYVLSTDTAWGENGQTTWYVASGNVPVANRITVTGDVRLILMDGATLTACRIDEGQDAELTIYGQSAGTGKLIVTNTNDPAIGNMSISLTVNGGAVEATSENGPAIFAGSFTVNGGTVTAIGNPATYKVTAGDGMTILAGSSAADAAPKSADEINSCKWVYIEKNEPLTGVTYLDEKGEEKTLNAGTLEEPGYTRVRPYTPTWSAGWYVVDKNVTIDEPVTVTGAINLILCDGATLTAQKGITFNNYEYKFTVYGQSAGTGKLTSGEPVFGKFNYVVMTFNGGVIDISVGENAENKSEAPIGAQEIIVNGGSVSGTGAYCEGINTNSVTINGGSVSGTSTSGYGIHANSVTINGGTVNAISNNSGGYAIGMNTSGIIVNGGVLNTYGLLRAIAASNDGVTVNGGSLTARSEQCAIYANLTVTGGTVLAEGMKGSDNGGDVVHGDVTVNGGSVTVIDGDGGTGQNGKAISGSVTLGTGIQVKAGDAETETFVTDYVENHNHYRWAKIARFHTHTLTNYALTKTNAENDTITATCTNGDGKCTLESPDHQAKLVILAPAEGGGAATLTGAADFDVTAADIKYYKGDEELTVAPTQDGFFKAQITVGGKTAYVTYGVNEIVTDKEYTIANDHGTVTVPAVATANATVTIATTPKTGYELDTLTVTKDDNSTVDAAVDGNNGTFTMPEESVTVSAAFKLRDYTITTSEMTNGSVTAAATAKMDQTVSLTVTPDTGYELSELKFNETAITADVNGDYKFTMPADDVTISAAFKKINYTITKSEMTNGNVTVAATAQMDDPVRITVTPADGYQLSELKFNGTAITADGSGDYKFTMPAENVTVAATFEKRDVGVKLETKNGNETCAAALLTDSYDAAPASFIRKVDETFVLSVACGEDYTFVINGSTPIEFRQLTVLEKRAYLEKYPNTDENTQLFKVTMPGVAEGDLTVRVTFLKIKNYTVLYRPGNTNGDTVWCKIGSGDKSFQLKMNPDAQMGNVKTFALNVSMTSDPQKIAFGTADLVADAPMTDVSVKASAAAAGTWQEMGSDKFLVIGGNARTVIAAFTPNNTPYAVNAADVNGLPTGTQYQIAVCESDAAGTVKAPAALTKNGFTFVGWGYKSGALGLNEKDTYDAGDDISITDDAIFGAVWTPATSTVTIDLKGGDIDGETKNVTIPEVPYNQAILGELQKLLPQKNGFALDGWTVNKSVTEGGKFFSRGSDFDPNTNITSNLELNAKWKHVHSYTCVPLNYVGFGDALKDYYGYLPYIHVRFCGCGDVELEAHTFRNDVCTGCGATKGGENPVTLDVSYWKDVNSLWMQEQTRTGLKKNEEVTVSAFYQIGDYKFSKWQYRFSNEDSWKDLAADTMVGFLIPASMQVRALYTLVEVQPQVSLSASKYVTEAQGYNWDTVLFQMEYKLPKNCTYVDAGIRMGDNQGISFYSLKKRKVSAFETAFNFITSDPISFAVDSLTRDPDYIIEKREDNVLGTMNAATLAKYMMENKPINIPEYEPIYWQANPATKGRSGSVNTLTPLRFIQKNNGNHYIYGVAYLRFKDSNNVEHTIYTDAIPVTRNTIPEKNTDTATYDTSN